MIFEKIQVHQFRNLLDVDFNPNKVNVLIGDNGSGKTSLLEAIYYFGHGRSFRTAHSHKLINHEAKQFNLLAYLQNNLKLGVEKNKQENKIKYDGEFIKNSSVLARLIPTQVINPDIHKLLEDSPRYRRKFIDWGVFHVKHPYGTLWKSFQQLLKQRNAALKKHWDQSLVKHWDTELISVVNQIHLLKQEYINQLQQVFCQYADSVTQIQSPSFNYYSGWPKDLSYEEALRSSWDQDKEAGFTRFGPHRADLILKVGVHRAKDIVSRGQQKLLAILLKLAQVKLYTQSETRPLVLLVDDLASELDTKFIGCIIELLEQSNTQLFVTATDTHKLEPLIQLLGSSMFHVEHGNIKEVV